MRTILSILLSFLISGSEIPQEATQRLTEDDGLSGNRVRCCFQDSRGLIWIGTSTGLDLYDGQVIQPYGHPTCSLAEVGGKVWAGTEAGLWTYSLSNGQFAPFDAVTKYGVNIISRVNALCVTEGTLLWAGTEGQGLFLYNTTTGELSQHSTRTPFVKQIDPTSDGRVLATDREGRVHIYSASGDYLRPSSYSPPPRRDTLVDRDGTRWVPSQDRGLIIINRKDSGVDNYPITEEADGPYPLAEDDEGNIFAGRRGKLYMLSPGQKSFSPIRDISSRSVITRLLYSPHGLWIGTDDDGIYRYVPATRILRHYPTGGATQALYQGANGNLLVGTNLGIFSYDPAEDKLSRELNRQDIRIILDGKPPKGNLKEFEVVSQSSVVAICSDGGNYLYIATSNRGIFRKDLVSKGWEHLISSRTGEQALPWNKLTSLFRGSDGTIWAGTDGEGFWTLQQDSLVFVRLHQPDRRLDESNIHGITEDRNSNLWISASSGLWRMDPHGTAATPFNFKTGSILYATDGRLYMGHNGGVTSFLPEDNASVIPPRVVIREMTVADSTLFIPPQGRNIQLSYRQNSFSIRLADLNYTNPDKHLYSWRLKGFDNDWSTPSSYSTAIYTKIPPGDYIFEARDSEDTLRITVRPPWWRTIGAIIAYILLGMLGIASIVYFTRNILRHRYAEMMKSREEEREKALYKQRIRFFLGLVHEIRTPLTLIRLQHEKDSPGSNDTITRNLDYMQETINKILTYDKNISGDIRMLRVRMDIRDIVSSVTETFAEGAAAEEIRLEIFPGDKPIYVYADEDMLTKILTNLLSNALKYTKNRITVSVAAEGEDAIVTVSDNGPGVRKDQRNKIFGMFYTSPDDSIAEASGIGVGLAYARQLAEAHKGSLTVEDAIPSGASFVLRIPLWKEEGVTSVTLPTPPLAKSGERQTVLVVEDNRELRETLRGELSSWYDIITAADGREAMEQVENKLIDVVVSDVMMPVMDGLELCRQIKGQLSYNHIPVILLTAKISLDAKSEGMESGADAYVEKPFSIRQLHAQIDNLLHLRDAFRKAVTNGRASQETDIKGPNADFIGAINESIEKQMNEESFSIETLAFDMAMSRTNFFRKFKALTGMTPNDYLKNYRLDRAAELIRGGDRINEAAEKTGFTSSSYFAKCFKARFGVLPKDYASSH